MLVEHARAGRADGSSPPGRRHLVLSARAVEFREEETVVKRWAAVRRRNKVLVIAAVALLAVPAAAFAHDSAWVFTGETGILSSDAIDQSGANCDGTFGIPFGTDPAWVRVGGSTDPNTPFVEVRGQVYHAHISHTDAAPNHFTNDLNAYLIPDPEYRHFMADGDMKNEDPDEYGFHDHATMENEWERGGIPKFAYPSRGDRSTMWGPLIFDCGHGRPRGTRRRGRLPNRAPSRRRLGDLPPHCGRRRHPGHAGEADAELGLVRPGGLARHRHVDRDDGRDACDAGPNHRRRRVLLELGRRRAGVAQRLRQRRRRLHAGQRVAAEHPHAGLHVLRAGAAEAARRSRRGRADDDLGVGGPLQRGAEQLR